MQQYTIGRSNECHIRVPDSKERISREHATLKVMDDGKIFIVDNSTNGTYVNGIKISQHVNYPVKRGDHISFANDYELDWKLIAKPKSKLSIYLLAVAALVVVGSIALFFLLRDTPAPPAIIEPSPIHKPDTVVQVDTVVVRDTIVRKVVAPEPNRNTKQDPTPDPPARTDTSKVIIFP